MKTLQSYFLLFFLVSISTSQPRWVSQQRIDTSIQYYFGIGISKNSAGDADARALIAFAQNVEIRVKSIFQREVVEEGKNFSDNTTVTEQLVSDVSLNGVAITERYFDSTYNNFYSLIKYAKTDYDTLVTHEIRREILLMKARNKMIEEKREEELRALKTRNIQEEEKKKEELRNQKKQIELEQENMRQEEEKKKLFSAMYKEFLASAVPNKTVTLRNGEITKNTSTVMLKGGLAPLQFAGGFYAFRFAGIEISGSAAFRDRKLNQQESFLKIQILPGVGEYTKFSLAIGMSQAVGRIADSGYSFQRSKYSFFIAGNYTDPRWEYSTVSLFGDKRRLSVGVTTFPFYHQFKNHLGFVLECNYLIDHDFRNRYNDPIVINGGLRLQANDSFSTQFTYEDNQQFTLTFEFQI